MNVVLKLVHVLAVIIFLGNISLGLFWKYIGDRTHDARIVAHTLGGIIRSDRLFTVPAIVVLIAAGVGTAILDDYPLLGTGWIFWSIVLFSIAGVAFGPVARLQREMYALMSRDPAPDEAVWAQYAAKSHSWDVWGSIALIAPLVAVALMVLKPHVPGLHF